MKYIYLVITVMLFGLGVTSCGGGSGGGTGASGGFLGAFSISSIELKLLDIAGVPLRVAVRVKFSGVEVTNLNGDVITELNLAAGDSKFISLLTKEVATNTIQDLIVIIEADGYIDSGATVQIVNGQAIHDINLKVVLDQNGLAAPGVFVKKENLANIDNNGVATQKITFETQEAADKSKLNITIPLGTTFTDKDGNSLVPEKVTVVTFNPNEAEALDAYPGGLNVIANVGGLNGQGAGAQQQIDFKSAGFASIIMEDANGNKIKNFDRPITITMQFPEGETDADGNVVNVGDTIPIWSYDEDTGEWSYETDADVQDLNNTDGFYDVTYTVNHLTYWNLDWFYSETCDKEIKLINGAGEQITEKLRLLAEIKKTNPNDGNEKSKSSVYEGESVLLARVPADRTVDFSVFPSDGGNLVIATKRFNNLCEEDAPSITISSNSIPSKVETSVVTTFKCESGFVRNNEATVPAKVVVFDTDSFLSVGSTVTDEDNKEKLTFYLTEGNTIKLGISRAQNNESNIFVDNIKVPEGGGENDGEGGGDNNFAFAAPIAIFNNIPIESSTLSITAGEEEKSWDIILTESFCNRHLP